MTVQAAMLYLRVLREKNKLSQGDIARVAGVESKQVYRWERGESEPPASGLVAFVEAVRGNIEDVRRLISNQDATEDLARQLAEACYASLLEREGGKEWIDENTTLGVVIGVGTVLGLLRLSLDRESWRAVRGAFMAAGAPMVVRGLRRKLG